MMRLGDLETAVMRVLWARGEPATVREVMAELDREPPLAYTTVMTVMDNLHRKELLSRERDGRAYRYRTVRSRAEHDAALMTEVLAASDDRQATLLKFVGSIEPEELDRLRRLMDGGAS